MTHLWSKTKWLQERCDLRGYTMDEVRPCIVQADGDNILVDIDHPAYPMNPKPGFVQKNLEAMRAESQRKQDLLDRQRGAKGPGTELKRMLRMVGITATPNCSCNARAQEMDDKGVSWCFWNVPTIVGWLEEEAVKREMTFSRAGARALVYAAIMRAAVKSAARTAWPGKKPETGNGEGDQRRGPGEDGN